MLYSYYKPAPYRSQSTIYRTESSYYRSFIAGGYRDEGKATPKDGFELLIDLSLLMHFLLQRTGLKTLCTWKNRTALDEERRKAVCGKTARTVSRIPWPSPGQSWLGSLLSPSGSLSRCGRICA